MKTPEGLQLTSDGFATERRELETVLNSGIFTPSSNAAKMLRFVCERYFENPAEVTTEYDVAVNALGRRPDFDAQKNSIVRVEAHGVRKRLQQYYEAEGAAHPVQIVLPRGCYTPQFVRPIAPPAPASDHPNRRRRLAWSLLAIAGLALAAIGLSRLPLSRRQQPTAAPPAAVAAGTAAPAPGDTVRILAGRASGNYVDRGGTRWTGDAWFTGGVAQTLRSYSLSLADDPAIFEHCRTGKDFSYDIPLRPGVYEMRLMFVEAAGSVPIMGEVGDGARSLNVLANGVQILPPPDGRHRQTLDIVADAGGVDAADVKVFKDISPAADGKLHLRFLGRKADALVNAIEIVPGAKGKMRTLRWRAYDAPYTDHEGNVWQSDRYFRGGRFSRFRATVGGTADPDLYIGERFGSFTYSVPVAAGSAYTVTVHFAENFWGPWEKPVIPRMFNVYANHVQLLRDFDVTKAAGGAARAVTRTFRGVKPNPFDKITLCFEPVTEFAILNAIEVEDEAK